jgi:hypothetical protein
MEAVESNISEIRAMRCVYTVLFLLAVSVASIAGLRGCASRRPPIELFADMARQPKARPESASAVFSDGAVSRARPEGTAPQFSATDGATNWDARIATGREPNSTNWVESNPLPVDRSFLERGRERYASFCASCHGAGGDGRGIVLRYNMAAMANFHDRRLIDMADGEMFDTIGRGKNLMNGYGGNVPIRDRWAIVAFVRALERARLALPEDAPPEFQARFIQTKTRSAK